MLKHFSFIILGPVFVFTSRLCKENRDGEKNGIALLEEGSGMPVDTDNELMSDLQDS